MYYVLSETGFAFFISLKLEHIIRSCEVYVHFLCRSGIHRTLWKIALVAVGVNIAYADIC